MERPERTEEAVSEEEEEEQISGDICPGDPRHSGGGGMTEMISDTAFANGHLIPGSQHGNDSHRMTANCAHCAYA